MARTQQKNSFLNFILFVYVSTLSTVVCLTGCGDRSSLSQASIEASASFSITSATVNDQQVTLSWTASTNATTYIVKHGTQSGSYTTTDSTNATSPYTVTGLTNGTTYYFMVQAIRTNDVTEATNNRYADSEISAIPAALPSAPSPTLDISNRNHWDLSWAPSTGTTPMTYTVSRTITFGSGYVDIPLCFNLGTTFCSDTTIAANSTYCYKVTATNIGASTSSTEICPPLSVPPTLTITSPYSSQIPSYGGAPPLTYSMASGTGSIDPQTGVFVSPQSGPSVINVTDANNNVQTITVNNLKFRTDGAVYAMVQSGNSLYIGGAFTTVNPTEAPRMIALDTTTGKPHINCDLQSGFNGDILKILHTDKALYVGGKFTQYSGQSANHIAKLNLPNCDLDTTFNSPVSNGFNNDVYALISTDSSLYVGGLFTAYKGVAGSANHIAKLDLNTGILDTTFSPPTNNGFNGDVRALSISGSNLYVGGFFTGYQNTNSANHIAKLNLTSGVLDTTFSLPANNGFNGNVYELASLGSSLYVGGIFTDYRGVAGSANNIAKLNLITGALDTAFSPPANNGFNGSTYAFAISGNALYVGGSFSSYKNVNSSANSIAKLNLISGAIDTTFSPPANNGFAVFNFVTSLAVSGTKLFVGGNFTSYRGVTGSTNNIAKLDLTTGAVDTTFNPPGSNGFDLPVYALASSGSELYVGGPFSVYKGGSASSANRIAKLDITSGAIDTTFSPPNNNGFGGAGSFSYKVYSLAISGASLYVGGSFTAYRGVTNSALYIAKVDLNNGAIDTTFSPPSNNGFNSIVSALYPSGTSLFVGGNFTDYRGVANSANRLAKLDITTGTLDTTFSPPANNGFNNIIISLVVSGTSLYVGGGFTAYKGVAGSANRIAKLDLSTGALDTAFNPPASNGFDAEVNALAVSGANLYVGGSFTSYNGVTGSANRIAKLNLTTGVLDTTFSPPANNGLDSTVLSLAVSGTNLFAGGQFTAYKGVANSAKYIVKLDPTTGAIDTTFSPPANNGFDGWVRTLMTSGTSLYVGGSFNVYRGNQSSHFMVPLDLTTGALVDP